MDRHVLWGRLGMIAVLAAGLALAGCGRKAGLDPPPSALNPTPAAAQPDEPPALLGSLFGEPPPPQAPVAPPAPAPGAPPPPPPKTFLLDFLIGR